MRGTKSRRVFVAGIAAIASGSVAQAALPPQYPTGMDSCRVAANAEPSIEYKPSPPGTPVAPGPGAGRIYTVPATLDCSPGGKHSGTYYLCQPSFLAWAKEACNGLNVRE